MPDPKDLAADPPPIGSPPGVGPGGEGRASSGPIGSSGGIGTGGAGLGPPTGGAGAPGGPGVTGGSGPITTPEVMAPAGRNIGPGGAIGTIALGISGRPIGPGGTIGEVARGPGGTYVAAPGLIQLPTVPLAGPSEIPSGQAISATFSIGGAPIAILGGVFSSGLPIGGPVTQIYRGGAAPIPNTLFINTLSPSGPISVFFIGSQGAPIGVDTFGGGGLPIGPAEPVVLAVQSIQPRTALVTAIAVAFGSPVPAGAAPPITGPAPVGGAVPPIGAGSVI